MKPSKELKNEKATQDTKSIENQLIEKRKKLEEIHGSLAVWFLKDMTHEQRSKVSELQDRLFFRTQQYELKLLDEKIDIYSQALNILKR